MQSAKACPLVVDEYLQEEVKLNQVIGPLPMWAMEGIQINRIGVIPKKYQPGKWRLIVDLSHPENKSVNDRIKPGLCSLSYVSVDDAVHMAMELGPGALMAKWTSKVHIG